MREGGRGGREKEREKGNEGGIVGEPKEKRKERKGGKISTVIPRLPPTSSPAVLNKVRNQLARLL